MKIIIDIDDDYYFEIKNAKAQGDTLLTLEQSVIDGTPLPKGHGNLIDTKEFIKSINDWADDVNSYEAYEEVEITKALLRGHAYTIIEADKAESEEEK